MDNSTAKNLLQHAEPMAALSITHLTASTRQKLAADDLSVNAYPNEYGGFVYVGAPRYSVPTEPDLAAIFDVAEQVGIVWLKFDSDAAGIDGLPLGTLGRLRWYRCRDCGMDFNRPAAGRRAPSPLPQREGVHLG